MTGWEFEDLMEVLESAREGDRTQLSQLLKANPFATVNNNCTNLLVLRKFQVRYWEGARSVFNAAPDDKNFQWGITMVTASEDGGSSGNVYLPNKYQYKGIELGGDEVTIIAEGTTRKTNIRELAIKLRDFFLEFEEEKLEAAFDTLNNEVYETPRVVEPEVADRVIENKVLGTLTYDEKYKWYSNNGTSSHFAFELNVNYENPETFGELLEYIETKMRQEFYAQPLLDMEAGMIELKNDSWLGEDEEKLTAEKFRQLISIESIVFYEDKSCTIYCNDGDIFWGHAIAIRIDEKGKFRDADLAG